MRDEVRVIVAGCSKKSSKKSLADFILSNDRLLQLGTFVPHAQSGARNPEVLRKCDTNIDSSVS
jgi:hypothetical protein